MDEGKIEYINQWISFLHEKGKEYSPLILDTYKKVVELYNSLDTIQFISVNLKKTHELFYC